MCQTSRWVSQCTFGRCSALKEFRFRAELDVKKGKCQSLETLRYKDVIAPHRDAEGWRRASEAMMYCTSRLARRFICRGAKCIL